MSLAVARQLALVHHLKVSTYIGTYLNFAAAKPVLVACNDITVLERRVASETIVEMRPEFL